MGTKRSIQGPMKKSMMELFLQDLSKFEQIAPKILKKNFSDLLEIY